MINHIGLHNRQFRSMLSFLVAALMIGSISYLGVTTFKASHAASGASMYLSPDSATVAPGSTLSVTIREDSGSYPVNSVQASLNYDANRLQFVSLTEGGVFPVTAATSTGTAGVIRVGRANSDTPVAGDHPIVTVNFKVTGAAGVGTIAVDKAYSLLVRSSDNRDILQNVGSGTYTVSGSGGSSSSATKPTLYINPAGGSYAPGAAVAVAVRLNSYDASVSTVEAAIGYPVNQLQYVGVSEGGVYTTKQRTNAANGVVDLIRGIPGGGSGIQGDNPVVTINFKVIGSGGTAGLSIAGASAVYDTSGTGQNILNLASSTGASYVIAAASGGGGGVAPPSPAPGSSPQSGGVSSVSGTGGKTSSVTSPAQAVTIGSGGSGSHVALTTDGSGNSLTELGGQVSLAPILDPAIFAKNPGDAIAKVEYYVDGKLVSTQKTSPFKYQLDTTDLRNGTYTMVVRTFYSSGIVDTHTDKLLIKNKVTLAYVMRHYIANILGVLAILVILGMVMWKLVIPRFSHKLPPSAAGDHDVMYGFRGPESSSATPGPVAGDPLVVAPTQAAAAGSDFEQTAYTPVPPPSSAAQTTQALPLIDGAPAAPAYAPVSPPPPAEPAPVASPRPMSIPVTSPQQPVRPTEQTPLAAPLPQPPVSQAIPDTFRHPAAPLPAPRSYVDGTAPQASNVSPRPQPPTPALSSATPATLASDTSQPPSPATIPVSSDTAPN